MDYKLLVENVDSRVLNLLLSLVNENVGEWKYFHIPGKVVVLKDEQNFQLFLDCRSQGMREPSLEELRNVKFWITGVYNGLVAQQNRIDELQASLAVALVDEDKPNE